MRRKVVCHPSKAMASSGLVTPLKQGVYEIEGRSTKTNRCQRIPGRSSDALPSGINRVNLQDARGQIHTDACILTQGICHFRMGFD